VTDTAATEIVDQTACEPDLPASAFPGLAKVAERSAVAMKDERAIQAASFEAAGNDRGQFADKRKRSSGWMNSCPGRLSA
jgi:hypothetical protein